ncbi:hypothetical protein [Rhodococcus sp. IEGM 1379]|nr:hypothetical protein [Rhodococcus sp. IEGM 1379]MDI9916888.1 hypothetical protein [Rhodococcus sp. IEGM 1379]
MSSVVSRRNSGRLAALRLADICRAADVPPIWESPEDDSQSV